MIRFFARNASRFIVLVLLQYFLNLIHFTPFDISPFFYIVYIMLLPFETPGWLILAVAFMLGISVDFQENSFGQHAFASVFIAGLRPIILSFIAERDEYEKGTFPRLVYFGLPWALRYAFLITFAHSIIFYSIEAFTVIDFWQVLAKATINSLITTALIIASQYWVFRKIA